MKKVIIISFILIAIFLLFSSTNNNNSTPSQFDNYSTSTNKDERIYETETYPEEYETTDSLEFNGYECTVDCSGHEAGYEWAEEHGITQDDVDNYSGNSNSFKEGMQSYVDENYWLLTLTIKKNLLSATIEHNLFGRYKGYNSPTNSNCLTFYNLGWFYNET